MTDGSQQPTPPPPPPGGTSQGQTPPPPAGGAAKKKGLPALAWVGIGCGALLILGLIAFVVVGGWIFGKAKDTLREFEENPAKVTAKAVVAANPDLEMVETDDAEGTITIRNKETGEVTTVDFEEVKQGKISFKSGDEEVTVGFEEDGEGGGAFTVRDKEGKSRFRMGSGGAEEIPEWIPRYPGSEPEGTFLSSTETKTEGGFAFGLQDGLDEVLGFYEDELEGAGFEVTGRNSWEAGGSQGATISAEEANRQIQVMLAQEGDRTQVTVTFSEEAE